MLWSMCEGNDECMLEVWRMCKEKPACVEGVWVAEAKGRQAGLDRNDFDTDPDAEITDPEADAEAVKAEEGAAAEVCPTSCPHQQRNQPCNNKVT